MGGGGASNGLALDSGFKSFAIGFSVADRPSGCGIRLSVGCNSSCPLSVTSPVTPRLLLLLLLTLSRRRREDVTH